MDFRFDLGHPALDFAATLRGRPDRNVEQLAAPADLDRWLREAGLASRPAGSAAQLTGARDLREAIFRLAEKARAGERGKPADVALVNEWARKPVPAPQIGKGLSLTATVEPDETAAALALVARRAIELVTSAEVARVRHCARCSMLFLDRSRPGNRRWCSMERCGNRTKTARYRASKRATT